MRYYETMYIVNPSFETDRLNKLIDTLNEEFEKKKVKVINHYIWGKKRLAYPIQNHRYGNYIIIHFGNEERNFLTNFGMLLKLNESVMRYQTVLLDKQPDVIEQRDIIVEDEALKSDQKTMEEKDNITDKPNSDSAESLEENDQKKTKKEDINSDQPEEKEE